LRRWPVASITSVSIASGDLNALTWTAFDPKSEYSFDPDTGDLYLAFAIARGVQNIKVVYKGGYTTAPYDLRLACQRLVAKEYNKRKSQGAASESIGGASISWEDDLTPDLKRTLDGYKRISF
jgi:hypothetical protein